MCLETVDIFCVSQTLHGHKSSFTRCNYAMERIAGFHINIQDSFILPFRFLIQWHFSCICFWHWYNDYLPSGFIHFSSKKKSNTQPPTITKESTRCCKVNKTVIIISLFCTQMCKAERIYSKVTNKRVLLISSTYVSTRIYTYIQNLSLSQPNRFLCLSFLCSIFLHF